jgi:hypothetical protein
MKSKKIVISTYNFDLSWVGDILFKNEFCKKDIVIYDRSEKKEDLSMLGKVINSPNIGSNIYDMLVYICDEYNSLSDITIFLKGNILSKTGSLGLEDLPESKIKYNIEKRSDLKYYTTEKRFYRSIKSECFLPIERYHPSSEIVLNGGKYVQKYWTPQDSLPQKYFSTYEDLVNSLFLNGVSAPIQYQRFCPGANYVIPKEVIKKYSINTYEKMKSYCGYGPYWVNAETYFIERLFYQMWTEDLVEL